tara:strand:- start:876 stop:1697 length:822 start_codon:yes stop_codon:yes gene_type:complete
MKNFVKRITPPIVIDFYNYIKMILTNDSPTSFTGVFDDYESIECQSPWEQKPWLDIQTKSLKGLLTQNNKLKYTTLNEFEILPCFIINDLSLIKPINVADIGGGSGLTFFKFLPYLKNSKNINYHIVDYGKLALIGKDFSKTVNQDFNLAFHKDFSDISSIKMDIIYSSSSIQFIYEYKSFIEEMCSHSPQHIILTQLPCGDFKTYFTKENQHGFNTPRIMFNYDEVISLFKSQGYKLDFEWPVDEFYPNSFYKKIPKDKQIRNSTSLIFSKD